MIVRCPECGTKFRLSEAQTQGRAQVRLRCSRCETVFTTRLADEPEPEPAAGGATRGLPSGGGLPTGFGAPETSDLPGGFGLDGAQSNPNVPRPTLKERPSDDPFADLQKSFGEADTAAGVDLKGLSGFLGSDGGRRYEDEMASVDGGGDTVAEPSQGFDPGELDALARDAFGRDSNSDSAIERAGKAAGTVDPFDAFHDVFSEGRDKASTDVQKALHGLDSGDDGAASGGSNLAFDPGDGGSLELADPFANVDDPPESDAPQTDEESQLLDLALMATGLEEPAPPPTADAPAAPEVRGESNLIRLDIAGDRARHQKESSRGVGLLMFAWSLLLTVATVVGALGWLAWQNDGLLDLKELDQMIGVAFRGETYEPRVVSIVRVFESDGQIVEEPLAAMPSDARDELVIEDVETSRYVSTSGVTMVVLHGAVTNRSEDTWRDARLRVELRDADGIALDHVIVPIGGQLEADAFEAGAADPAALEAAWDDLAARAAALELAPNQQARFTAAWPVPADETWDTITWRATPWHAERYAPSTCWDRVAFTDAAAADLAEADASDDEDDAAGAPAEGSADGAPAPPEGSADGSADAPAPTDP